MATKKYQTSVGELVFEPSLKIGAKLISDLKIKSFERGNKIWHVSKDKVVHAYTLIEEESIDLTNIELEQQNEEVNE